jgi:hypothetical protein
MVLWTLFGLVLVAGLFPKTSIGRLFRTALFGDPDRPDASLKLSKIGKALVVGLALLALTPALPADIALIFAGDLALYLEVTAAVMLAGVIGWARGAARGVAMIIARVADLAGRIVRRASQRAPRQRRARRPAKPSGSDEAGPGLVFA